MNKQVTPDENFSYSNASLRKGDHVQVAAPANTLAAAFNGFKGELKSIAQGGWFVVDLEGAGLHEFRSPDLLVF